MATSSKFDNSTFEQKAGLRRALRRLLRRRRTLPVICETHGGTGRLFAACYADVGAGVVFERDGAKASLLARQRPTWAVYEADCVPAIRAGAGRHLEINVLDVDPYGDPWPTIDAFLGDLAPGSARPRPRRVWIVVNDGLRTSIRYGRAWADASMAEAVRRFGNDLFDRYLEVCRWRLEKQAAGAGYSLRRWVGYYAGGHAHMTHYLAELERASRMSSRDVQPSQVKR